MQAQMKTMKDEVIAVEVLKQTTRGQTAKSFHRDIKDLGKLPKLKSKWAAKDNWDDQLAGVGFPSDDLKGVFNAMMNTSVISWLNY